RLRRAQVTARWPTKSGLEMCTTLGLNCLRSRRTRADKDPGSRSPGRPETGTPGQWRGPPVAGKAGGAPSGHPPGPCTPRPTNQFWRLLGSAIREELQSLDYEERLVRLAERRIGLWDVIASASRAGSLDQAIRDAEHNQIEHLLHDFADLRAVAFNGSTAVQAGR